MIAKNNVYIIAEAGVNHNGRLELALKLCDAAKSAGVDAVKFQTWKTENVITRNTRKANYQVDNTGSTQDQFDMLKDLELSYDNFVQIKRYCDQIGITFLSTADEIESLDFLLDLGINLIKVGSGEITNIPFLREVGKRKYPTILSTGMANLSDTERAYRLLIDSGAKEVALLHCTTNYPCPMDEVNLRAMQTLREAFKCEIGYSDHTMGIEIPIAAVAMGARIIEKHFTLDQQMEGPDHKASLTPKELTIMVQSIRNIEKALGSGIKEPNKSEQEISSVVLKKIVAQTMIQKGDLLTEKNITVKRSTTGIPGYYWDLIVNTPALQNYEPNEAIKLITDEF